MSDVITAGLSEDIPLEFIEAELRKAMAVGREDDLPGRRARMSNLVIFCDRCEHVEAIQETIPRVVVNHPARVIVALVDPDEAAGRLRGGVNVWCHTGGEVPQHICSEQITLRTGPDGRERVPFAVRSFLIGDLPTNIWWTSTMPPALAGPFLDDLVEGAQQIIYDSNGWPEPPQGVAATAHWLDEVQCATGPAARWRVAADLNWRRLKYWRRLLAQALDPNSVPGALESISEVHIQHGPHAVVQAWQLVSWLASRLGWQVKQGKVEPGVEFAWQVEAAHGSLSIRINRLAEGTSEIRCLDIACQLDKQATILRFAPEAAALVFSAPGHNIPPRKVSAPPPPLDELVSRQLSDRERDPVFRESMATATVMAQSLLH
jgi:glucose-6-phosphate dehydrogenase assembly protein OpcA